ncbi:hypothetical protein OM298_00460 [Escherichia albertii]|nr:hypothetical protein [Escherichia albertii]
MALCSSVSVKSLANDLIIRQFNLSTEQFDLNNSLLFYINNWDLLPLICLLAGCHFYRDKFAERGLFYKIPHVIRQYYENSPVLLTDKLLHKPKSVNYIDIISFGFRSCYHLCDNSLWLFSNGLIYYFQILLIA